MIYIYTFVILGFIVEFYALERFYIENLNIYFILYFDFKNLRLVNNV